MEIERDMGKDIARRIAERSKKKRDETELRLDRS